MMLSFFSCQNANDVIIRRGEENSDTEMYKLILWRRKCTYLGHKRSYYDRKCKCTTHFSPEKNEHLHFLAHFPCVRMNIYTFWVKKPDVKMNIYISSGSHPSARMNFSSTYPPTNLTPLRQNRLKIQGNPHKLELTTALLTKNEHLHFPMFTSPARERTFTFFLLPSLCTTHGWMAGRWVDRQMSGRRIAAPYQNVHIVIGRNSSRMSCAEL